MATQDEQLHVHVPQAIDAEVFEVVFEQAPQGLKALRRRLVVVGCFLEHLRQTFEEGVERRVIDVRIGPEFSQREQRFGAGLCFPEIERLDREVRLTWIKQSSRGVFKRLQQCRRVGGHHRAPNGACGRIIE